MSGEGKTFKRSHDLWKRKVPLIYTLKYSRLAHSSVVFTEMLKDWHGIFLTMHDGTSVWCESPSWEWWIINVKITNRLFLCSSTGDGGPPAEVTDGDQRMNRDTSGAPAGALCFYSVIFQPLCVIINIVLKSWRTWRFVIKPERFPFALISQWMWSRKSHPRTKSSVLTEQCILGRATTQHALLTAVCLIMWSAVKDWSSMKFLFSVF